MSSRRLALLLALLAGCDRYQPAPADAFQVRLVGPAPGAVRTFRTTDAQFDPLTCATSDFDVQLEVEVQGCSDWELRHDAVPSNVRAHKLDAHHATLVWPLRPHPDFLSGGPAPTAGTDERFEVICRDSGSVIALPLLVQVEGASSVRLDDQGLGAVQQVASLLDGHLALRTESELVLADPALLFGDRPAAEGEAALAARLHGLPPAATLAVLRGRPFLLDGDDLVAASVAGFTRRALPLHRPALAAGAAGLAAVGEAGPGRLRLAWESMELDPAQETLVELGDGFTGRVRSLGADVAGDLRFAAARGGHLWSLSVAGGGGVLGEVDLGPLPEGAGAPDLWTAPDGTYAVLVGAAPEGACPTAWVRPLLAPAEGWSFPACEPEPTFLPGTLVLVTTPDGRPPQQWNTYRAPFAFDPATGDKRWLAAEVFGGHRLAGAGDALLYQNEALLQVVGASGDQRLWWGGLEGATSAPAADLRGNLYVGLGSSLLRVKAADAALHEPPRRCAAVACPSGPTDLDADPANCGACGRACARGELCEVGGSCCTLDGQCTVP